MRQPRICFGWRPAYARTSDGGSVDGLSPLPRPPDGSLQAWRRSHLVAGNRGYLVIGEAAGRLFACDQAGSGFLDLPRLANEVETGDLVQRIDAAFDLLVLPMAYEIGMGVDYSRLVQVLSAIRVPIVTLGLGIACDPQTPLAALPDSVAELLSVLDRRAVLFGVRADVTRDWLHRHGFSRAVALGCPSLHLYPHKIMRLDPPTQSPDRLAYLTGGYLLRDRERGRALSCFFEGASATYVLQDEPFVEGAFDDDDVLFDDARQEMDAVVFNAAVERIHGYRPSFRQYRYFDSLDAWRCCAAAHHVFIGDRFHGGVVALQTGTPTVLFLKDVRARELSEFYDIPRLELHDAVTAGCAATVDQCLSTAAIAQLKAVFADRHETFLRSTAACDLRFSAQAFSAQAFSA
jgi:hypothetical protein